MKRILSLMFVASLISSQINAFTANITNVENKSDTLIRIEAPFTILGLKLGVPVFYTQNVAPKEKIEKPEEKKLLGLKRSDQEVTIFDYLKINPFNNKKSPYIIIITKTGFFVLFTTTNHNGGVINAKYINFLNGKENSESFIVLKENVDLNDSIYEYSLVIQENGSLEIE